LSAFFERRIHHITPSATTGIQMSHFMLASPPLAFAGHGAFAPNPGRFLALRCEGASGSYSPDTSAFVI
jgi:hypothetical protein